MSENSVEEVQRALGFTEADADALKKVKLVWKKLETLRQKAVKDSSQLKSYRDALEKSLVSARLTTAVDDPEAEATAFWHWYNDEYERLGIAQIEARRGSTHLVWSEKWLKADAKAFDDAVNRMIELPSAQNFKECRDTASKLLRAYVEAIEGS